ncbi:type II toxin-antitoxin system PemK/MazF family toxin [Nocardiopsis sp. HNM0947]|uniref:mRNA interferase n=1 Tax=Nocardiopsis coralli TaxID=2772213 RepID=A0ABR9PC96_9ACTN|nr:type II toxin-antitoxin system PemK/MazF family toxin [Nocardiopsis coralli]MBE3001466.1 type II toxin-antitoxin system PemK/MazF family toxin [Nocardiopsis coralli]
MRRGEIFMADLGEPVGHEQALRRPVLLVNAQPWLDSRPPVVTALPLTRTRRPDPTHVEIEPGASGLKEISYVKCEDLRAISPVRLERRFGHVDEAVMLRVETILRRLLAL